MLSSIIGNKLKVSVFGESHGPAIGVVIDGLPSGVTIDLKRIQEELERRAPGRDDMSTSRKEEDVPKILSGIFEGKTTGAPLTAIFENNNIKSKDYSELKIKPRPSHADYPAFVKYKGFNDYRGGGHFSGRLTLALVFAGAICKSILEEHNIYIGSHIRSIGRAKDDNLDMINIDKDLLISLKSRELPTLNKTKVEEMKEEILKAKEAEDSVGGIIEGIVLNLPVGLGSPMFDSIESSLAHMLFSIPAVKGVEFGEGFALSGLRGSEAKDEYYYEDGRVKAYSNNNGGILGGISTGMPLIFSVAIKPTASIGQCQRTINIETAMNDILKIQGRHDPCIVKRAVPVIEGAAAITILDLLLQQE